MSRVRIIVSCFCVGLALPCAPSRASFDHSAQTPTIDPKAVVEDGEELTEAQKADEYFKLLLGDLGIQVPKADAEAPADQTADQAARMRTLVAVHHLLGGPKPKDLATEDVKRARDLLFMAFARKKATGGSSDKELLTALQTGLGRASEILAKAGEKADPVEMGMKDMGESFRNLSDAISKTHKRDEKGALTPEAAFWSLLSEDVLRTRNAIEPLLRKEKLTEAEQQQIIGLGLTEHALRAVRFALGDETVNKPSQENLLFAKRILERRLAREDVAPLDEDTKIAARAAIARIHGQMLEGAKNQLGDANQAKPDAVGLVPESLRDLGNAIAQGAGAARDYANGLFNSLLGNPPAKPGEKPADVVGAIGQGAAAFARTGAAGEIGRAAAVLGEHFAAVPPASPATPEPRTAAPDAPNGLGVTAQQERKADALADFLFSGGSNVAGGGGALTLRPRPTEEMPRTASPNPNPPMVDDMPIMPDEKKADPARRTASENKAKPTTPTPTPRTSIPSMASGSHSAPSGSASGRTDAPQLSAQTRRSLDNLFTPQAAQSPFVDATPIAAEGSAGRSPATAEMIPARGPKSTPSAVTSPAPTAAPSVASAPAAQGSANSMGAAPTIIPANYNGVGMSAFNVSTPASVPDAAIPNPAEKWGTGGTEDLADQASATSSGPNTSGSSAGNDARGGAPAKKSLVRVVLPPSGTALSAGGEAPVTYSPVASGSSSTYQPAADEMVDLPSSSPVEARPTVMTSIVPDKGKVKQAMDFIEQTMESVGSSLSATWGEYFPANEAESVDSPEALASDAVQALIRSNIKKEMKKTPTEAAPAKPYNAPKTASEALEAASQAIAARIPAAAYLEEEKPSDLKSFILKR